MKQSSHITQVLSFFCVVKIWDRVLAPGLCLYTSQLSQKTLMQTEEGFLELKRAFLQLLGIVKKLDFA